MIFGNIRNKHEFKLYPEPIQKALNYLADSDFETLSPGVYELDNENLFAEVQELITDCSENRKAESHILYTDIHFLVTDKEKIGHSHLNDMQTIIDDLRPQKDMIYYNNPIDETFLMLKPGDYAIFFSTDLHRPGCKYDDKAPIKKVVVKIKNTTLF